jgi:hypothetical protein
MRLNTNELNRIINMKSRFRRKNMPSSKKKRRLSKSSPTKKAIEVGLSCMMT